MMQTFLLTGTAAILGVMVGHLQRRNRVPREVEDKKRFEAEMRLLKSCNWSDLVNVDDDSAVITQQILMKCQHRGPERRIGP